MQVTRRWLGQRRLSAADAAAADFVCSFVAPKSVIPGVGQRAWWRPVFEFFALPWPRDATRLDVGAVGASACWARACGALQRRRRANPVLGTAGMSGARLNTVYSYSPLSERTR